MKLIIKEYLASLKERDELDAMLPDLLSQMGLNVYSRPSRGTRQGGVDVAAVGCLKGKTEKVYLFSIKSGNLTRSTWDGTPQDLRSSLNQILDAYIPNLIPVEHRNKPIVICLCMGGDIQEPVRTDVEGYIKQNSKKNIKFEEWNGDKLAENISKYFLREDLLPQSTHSLLRKSLALLDEPEVSYKNFSRLVNALTGDQSASDDKKITAIRQLNICLWILFAWCREANNFEPAYISSELALLRAWEIYKPFIGKTTRTAEAVKHTLESILCLYMQITSEYLNCKILPHTDKLHALSNAVKSSCNVDINLKLFDVLGRIALGGIWTYWQFQCASKDDKLRAELLDEIHRYHIAIKQLIVNNPILFSPYKDDQVIDIAIAVNFLLLDENNSKDIHGWLGGLTKRTIFNFKKHSNYPCNLHSYHELIEYPLEDSVSYRNEITAGSVLYPMIAIYSALLGFDDIYNEIQSLKNKYLKHCNFQLWYPNGTSEERFYTDFSGHGSTLSHVCIEKTKEEFLEQVFKECQKTSLFYDMSAVKENLWPIILLGCRHYRLPIPLHFIEHMN